MIMAVTGIDAVATLYTRYTRRGSSSRLVWMERQLLCIQWQCVVFCGDTQSTVWPSII